MWYTRTIPKSYTPIEIPCTTKPPAGTQIDWSNPLTQGLVGAWAFNEGAGKSPVNCVNNIRSLHRYGSLDWRAGNCVGSQINLELNTKCPTGAFSVVFRYKCPPNPQQLLFFNGKSAPSPVPALRLRASEGTSTNLLLYLNNNAWQYFHTDSTVYNNLCTTILTLPGNSATDVTLSRCYINGKEMPKAIGQAGLQASRGELSIGQYAQAYVDGTFEFLYVFSRVLSPLEAALITQRPYGVYEPRLLWTSAELASGTITTPDPIAPSNDALNVAQPVTFSWSAVSGYIEYQIEIATDFLFTNIVDVQNTSNTSIAISGLAPATKHYWRVRGNNG